MSLYFFLQIVLFSCVIPGIINLMCVAALLPFHGFGILVPCGGQSLPICPCFLHLKHLPSFMSWVLSLVISLSISIASGFCSCSGNMKFFFGVSFFGSGFFPWPNNYWDFLQFPWNVEALLYHPWSIVGGFLQMRMDCCRPWKCFPE